MLILIICLEGQANSTLPVISEVYRCDFYYIMKYDIKFKKSFILYYYYYEIEILKYLGSISESESNKREAISSISKEFSLMESATLGYQLSLPSSPLFRLHVFTSLFRPTP